MSEQVDVAAIREALAKATPGEWEGTGLLLSWQEGGNNGGELVSIGEAERHEDGELIVLLRNNAEALLDALNGETVRADNAERDREREVARYERARAAAECLDMLVAQAERRGAEQERERYAKQYRDTAEYSSSMRPMRDPYGAKL